MRAEPTGHRLGAGDRIAYLISRYPAATNAFIAEETRAMRDAGVDVQLISIWRTSDSELTSDTHRRDARTTHSLLPPRWRALLGAHLLAATRAPVSYGRALLAAVSLSSGGVRALVWQLFYFAEAIMLWDHMRRRGLRHVHVHFPTGAADAAMLATSYANRFRAAGEAAPRWTWSWTCHGPTEFTEISSGRLAAKVERADAVICVSHWAYSQILGWVPPSRPERVHVVPLGVDLTLFSPDERDRDDDEPIRILNVAGMSPRKGQAVLLRAFARLRSAGRHVGLTVAGDGDERSSLEAEARRLGVADHVEFLGAVGHDQVAEQLRRCDIFCLPSFAEGLPMVLMEAMAAGKPVVSTAIAGTPELIENGVSGLLVPPAHVDALAQALDRLVSDPALRRQLARQGRNRVEQQRDLFRQTEVLRGVLGAAIAAAR